MDNSQDQIYVMIPNVAVQNITTEETTQNSYIQLFGKRTVVYLKQLIEIQNVNLHSRFSIDMILWMSEIETNIRRERKYFKEFLSLMEKNSFIDFIDNFDIESISSSQFVMAKLNIFEYSDDGKKKNYFKLLKSEYDLIMKDYSGDLDKYNLLNLFCNLKSRMWKNATDVLPFARKPEVAYPSYDTIRHDIFIESHKTLKQYIDALVELDLIRFGWAGGMKFITSDQQMISRKAYFTYTLFTPIWETELENSISDYKSKKIIDGWTFVTEEKETFADERRSVTQKINMLEKKSKERTLTQAERKAMGILKRQQEKWKSDYDTEVDIRRLEDESVFEKSKIFEDMSNFEKAQRAFDEEERIREDNNVVEDNFGKQTESNVVVVDFGNNTRSHGRSIPQDAVVEASTQLIEGEHKIKELLAPNEGELGKSVVKGFPVPKNKFERVQNKNLFEVSESHSDMIANAYVNELASQMVKADEQKLRKSYVDKDGLFDLDKLIEEEDEAV